MGHIDRPEVSSPATTLWPSGTHWTRGASPNKLKGPLIAKRKNEGLPLTGDELCWHERKTPTRWRKVVLDHSRQTFWVGVGEARMDITEMALGSETWELNTCHYCLLKMDTVSTA